MEIQKGLNREVVISSLSAGFVLGVLIVFLLVSFAALIFSGDLDPFLFAGIGVLFVGSLILIITVTLTSSLPMVVTLPQDAPVVIMAGLAASISASMAGSSPEMMQGTIFSALLLTTVFTGLFFWLLGRFNLGRLVRFIPYPVVGGFLAGTGWLLIIGGISIMAGRGIDIGLLEPDVLLRWLPGFLYAGLIFILSRRINHFLLLPGLILLGIVIFYLGWFISGGTIRSALAGGWLLGPFPEGSLFLPTIGLIWGNVNWIVLLEQGVLMTVVLLVSAITYLLNISGLEISLNRHIDLNHELRSSGIANILAGLGGAYPGFTSVSLTALADRLGAASRLVGLTVAGLVLVSLLVGAGFLGLFPRVVTASIIIYIGFLFLLEWLYEAYFKLSQLEYVLIWVILIIIARFGFLEGVVAGLVIAAIFFVINYSRVSVTRHSLTGADYQSQVMRPHFHQKVLKDKGLSLTILELQGYIFFGTAHNFLEQIRERVERKDECRLEYLLLDFRLVSGIDSSAMLTFQRLLQLLKNNQIYLVITHLKEDVIQRWQRDLLQNEDMQLVKFFPELGQGVAWCEQQILDNNLVDGEGEQTPTLMQHLEVHLRDQQKSAAERGYHKDDEKFTKPIAERIAPYIQRLEIEADHYVLKTGEDVQGLHFVESGQVLAKGVKDEGHYLVLRTMEKGTVFGEISMFTHEGQITADVVAARRSVLLKLTYEKLQLMELEDPQLAIAFHHVIAENLAEKLVQTSNALVAFQSSKS